MYDLFVSLYRLIDVSVYYKKIHIRRNKEMILVMIRSLATTRTHLLESCSTNYGN